MTAPGDSAPATIPPPILPGAARNPVGWICLGMFLALMLFAELSSMFAPHKASAKRDRPYETALEFAVSARRFADYVGTTSRGKPTSPETDGLSSALDELRTKSRTDTEAAREYGAMLGLRKAVAPESCLATLHKSKTVADRTLADVLAAKTLTMAEASRMASRLPDDPFVYKLGRAIALEKAGDHEAMDRAFTGERYIALLVATIGGLAVLAGSILVWILLFRAWREGRLHPAGTPMQPAALADADRMVLRAAQIVGLFLLISVYGIVLAGPGHGLNLVDAAAVEGVLIVLVLPVIALGPVGGRRITLADVGISNANIGRNALWGLGGFLFEIPISSALLLIGLAIFRFLPAPSSPVGDELENAKNAADVLPILFFGSITAPLWEEFVFRGLLFPAFGRVFGRLVPGALCTSFLFAMVHPQGISAWMGLAAVGCVGCALTYQTRSLVPTIVMHMLHNSAIFAVAILGMAPV